MNQRNKKTHEAKVLLHEKGRIKVQRIEDGKVIEIRRPMMEYIQRVGRSYNNTRVITAMNLLKGLYKNSHTSFSKLMRQGEMNAIGFVKFLIKISDERYVRNGITLATPSFHKRVLGSVSDSKGRFAGNLGFSSSAFRFVGHATWPKPSGIVINMMPFRINDISKSLPKALLSYEFMILNCRQYLSDTIKSDKEYVAYLTITESRVEKGKTQRRPGLHVEKPNTTNHDGFHMDMYGGMFGGSYIDGGIFMVSDIDDTCKLWNAQVSDTKLIGWEGDIEHLRDHLNDICMQTTWHTPKRFLCEPKIKMKANHIYWITDQTPHEALPLKQSGTRRFFRLVAGPLTKWHAKHNTANPLGIKPSCDIVHEDKFLERRSYMKRRSEILTRLNRSNSL